MALRNPVFNSDAFSQGTQYSVQPPAPAQGYNAPQYGQGTYGTPMTPPQYGQQQAQQGQQNPANAAQWASQQHMAQQAAFQAQMEGMYAAPAAGALETDRMTIEDTVMKTLALFGILLATAVVGWVWTLGGTFDASQVAWNGASSVTMVPWMIGAFGAFIVSMVVIFTSRKTVRPWLIFVYAALEGLFIGAISAFFEAIWPGIVIQATLATVAVVGVVLALFASGKIRASKKVTKIFMVAMFGYLAYSLINVVLMWTNVLPNDMMFGMSSGMIELGPISIPIGALIGIVVILLASYSLVLDFDAIQQGVNNGAPRKQGWMGAFGIMVTVVWLYIEILRLIAILRGND